MSLSATAAYKEVADDLDIPLHILALAYVYR